MNDRIKRMAEGVLKKTIYPEPKVIEYDENDLFLSDVIMQTKRLCDYMVAQDVAISDDSRLVGQIRFNACPYPSDVFPRMGHKRFSEVCGEFYCKQIENLVSFEWQHSTPDYSKVIEQGITGFIDRIHKSKDIHKDDTAKMEFLSACEMMCNGILAWEDKCADECLKKSESTDDARLKSEFYNMANVLKRVPRYPATNFREAIQSLYFCFDFLSDSIGTIDRYLYKYYIQDINNGTITKETAKELLQEVFIRIQSHTPIGSSNFYRGGECHFAIGGYTIDGEDGYNELSDLIVDALMELPLYIPQISLRWTEKTSVEVLKKLMDCERNDPNKRIAFVNDEPRIKGFMQNAGVSPKEAVNYTMVGCNEPALQGGIWLGGLTSNVMHSMENTLYKRKADIVKCNTYEDFYGIYKEELYKDLEEIIDWSNKFNYARSKDINVLSSLFMNGCIESGKSVTQGGSIAITGTNMMGLTNVIDSLSIVKQFVYEEKTVSMEELLTALENNWEGYEELHNLIMKKGKFFGNSYELSDRVAQKFTMDLHDFFDGKTNIFGKRCLLGNLTGYNQHYAWFGKNTKATPDGRYAGEQLSLGIGQSDGKDREGLSALLASVAGFDPTHIFTGPSVTNINLDSQMIYNDDNFEKTIKMIETYFKIGGLHVQINSVKREDLLAAQKTPDKYKTLRVRVSGFSDYFVNLNEDLQENIIERTKIEA